MTINPSVFKAYDIRGLCPGELDADTAYAVGQAIVRFTDAKTVVVGRDMRSTTPDLFDALADGVMSQGADVVSIGRVTTPMFYFAVGEYDLHDAGVMITASHNPAKYNGLKLNFGDVLPIGGNTGMKDIRDLALAGPYPEMPRGRLVETDVRESYLARLFEHVRPEQVGELRVVLDGGNGMAGEIVEDVFANLPTVKMTSMYLEPDGTFPNHEANPLNYDTLDELKAEIKRVGADVGFAFDGDADRIGVIDETGAHIPGDKLLALLATEMLKEEPGGKVAYTVNSSMVVEEEILAAGGVPVMVPVGHGLIKPIMRRENIFFAGELSFHFYFRDFFWGECTDIVALRIMALMTERGQKLSEIVAPYRRYFASGEINSEVEDKDGVIASLKQKYGGMADATVSTIDGLRVDFRFADAPEENWWFNVRASNTEPLLRLNCEAKSKEKMERVRDELLAVIRG